MTNERKPTLEPSISTEMDVPQVNAEDPASSRSPDNNPIENLTKEEAAEALRATLQQYSLRIPSFLDGLNATVAPLAQAFKNFGPMLVDIAKALAELPQAARAGVNAAANEGWFYDPDIGLDVMLKSGNLFLDGDRPGGDAVLMDHFRMRIDQIEPALAAALPKRQRFIKQAFAAHRREEFALSIPLLLAQADGASKELRDGHFFLTDRKTKKRETAEYANLHADSEFDRIALHALMERLPIMIQMDKLPPDFDTLNRHAVMHGSSLDYDTELNSLKAISLLNYVVVGLA